MPYAFTIDVLTVQEADMMGAADEAHLVFATSEGRVIFTQDADFLRLHAQGVEHFGIVYAPQHSPIGRIIRALVAIHQTLRSEDMQNNVRFI